MTDKTKIKEIAEECIEEVGKMFYSYPRIFYTEADLQSFLYHILYEKILGKEIDTNLCSTREGYNTIILHREYPTVVKYNKRNCFLVERDGKTRGHYDLVVLDTQNIEEKKFREQKSFLAIELKLVESNRKYLSELHNDFFKLRDEKNTRYGYLLFFVRNIDFKYEYFKKCISKLREEYPENQVKIYLVVHHNHPDKKINQWI